MIGPLGASLAAALATAPSGEVTPGCEAPYPLKVPDGALSALLENALIEAGHGASLTRGDLAVGFVDLSPSKNGAVYAALNPNRMLYAASLPKIVLLLGMARGDVMPWTSEVAARCEAMICGSSNADATWAFEQIGLDRLEGLVRAPGFCFYGSRYGGLWVGRAYAPGRSVRRDPVRGISHGATVRQTLRFYTLLERGLLGDARVTRRMYAAMAPPQLAHKFVKGLAGRDQVRFLARKSGTWRTYHSDSALIAHGERVYAAVALADDPEGGRAMPRIIQVIDDLVMERAGLSRLRRPP